MSGEADSNKRIFKNNNRRKVSHQIATFQPMQNQKKRDIKKTPIQGAKKENKYSNILFIFR
jgi:hypothetical protein